MPQPSRGGPAAQAGAPATTRVVLAFGAVYFVWGSTYLAIRWAIETMPPLLMASARFLVAGVFLYGWARARGIPRPTASQWKAAAISGSLLLVGGNGAVVTAEQWVPSGLVALLAATVPLWMVLLDVRFGARVRPSRRAVVGLAVGFTGVVLLAGSPGVGAGGARELFGGFVVLCGSLSWAAGSIYSRYTTQMTRPELWVGMQMLAGGTVLGLLSLALGEPFDFDVGAVSLRSALSLVYLIVFGAVVAYGAYIWLLTVVEPAKVATYAYVNPVVAMALGWGLAGEPLTGRSVLAGAVIIGAVVMISGERRAVPTRGVVQRRMTE